MTIRADDVVQWRDSLKAWENSDEVDSNIAIDIYNHLDSAVEEILRLRPELRVEVRCIERERREQS